MYYWWKKLQYRKGYVEKEEINPKKVVFEAYMGKKYACSPKALYQAMCRDPQYRDWELIWAFREPERYREMEKSRIRRWFAIEVGNITVHMPRRSSG